MSDMVERYPDPAVRVLDPAFNALRLPLAGLECLWTGGRWGEGPVWFGDHRCLIWSDIPNNRMLRWSESTGLVDEFRKPSNNANGNTRDREGRLVTCEHLTGRVVRTEHDGRITVIAEHYQGKRLNSPNDVVVKSDGSIWFTDPPFGLLGFYEGERREAELPHTNLYRLDGQTGAITCVADDVNHPNGLAFSPDESILYVIESRSEPRNILAYDVAGAGLRNRRVLVRCEAGETPDGFRVDVAGNLWCGWGMGAPGLDGVKVFNPAGAPIGFIDLPERCANLAFGGRHRNRLFMAASKSLYSIYVNTQGAV
ncbi:SMP-30/gluconolactonase/LRE family protein [Roseococcus sp. SDR]|uniref:SMP-30/gluconolactonase/LRE family protein n=1 Tax=Roseococcus sp. SDR TaxID=2835532 RepID=UPI001BCAB4E6|nr:SMP-30/gluconolactonase/LRE family protein [Roseococcus sp. SDR]MBS7789622.1 SMP-30/gluconolactonase/LRE family protein [Roseococcus sp. SDR]MBV1844936.1 SMP-30/gluconolactonase/LRE family protein [Roseococcus sp. SDR]